MYNCQYNINDYLGNTRVVQNATREARQDVDCHCFASIGSIANLQKNKYLCNGKEYQDETLGSTLFGQLDYGARFYDPVIARWQVVDPLAVKYYSYSVYNYCLNNPLRFIDPNGKEVKNGHQKEREEALKNLEATQKNFNEKHGGNMNKEKGDFSSKKEFKEYKKDRRAVNSSTREFKNVDKDFQQVKQSIDNFKKVDSEGFAIVDNLTSTDKSGTTHNVDVIVSIGGTKGNAREGTTNATVKTPIGIIKDGQINITLSSSTGVWSNRLAHEFGHSVALAANPIDYNDAVKASPGHDCQDPKNRNSDVSKEAMDWQERYDKLYKQYLNKNPN